MAQSWWLVSEAFVAIASLHASLYSSHGMCNVISPWLCMSYIDLTALFSLSPLALSVQFELPVYTFTEAAQEVTIRAVLSTPASIDVTVLFTPLDGTANGMFEE